MSRVIAGGLVLGLAVAFGSLSASDAFAQQKSQRSVDQADLNRDKQNLQDDQGDYSARKADENWEIKKNGGCGSRCQNDRNIEADDKDRIDQDKKRIKGDKQRLQNDD